MPDWLALLLIVATLATFTYLGWAMKAAQVEAQQTAALAERDRRRDALYDEQLNREGDAT
jgi:hypothetical protein